MQQLRLQEDPLPLPFFDDFANFAHGVPDPVRWKNGGVFINNRYALEPVTIGVATFDGLNAAGVPYAPNVIAPGPSDTLTSQPVQLAGLSPADSVYLSFYWQSGGVGDVPDRSSTNSVYLQLEFKDATGAWQMVWQQPGVGERTDFAQVFVGVKEARFFHENFQFRFRSVGRRSGLADVWNIDYVELDRNRRKNQNTTSDVALSRGLTPLLKNYTAIPVQQFIGNPEGELAEEVSVTVNNLGNVPAAISWRGYVAMATPEAPADTFLNEAGIVPENARQFVVAGTPRVSAFTFPEQPFKLVHGVFLDTKEQNDRYRANDSVSRETDFADYFAYDDGSAEAGFNFISTGVSQVAQRYELNKSDQVRAFRVYFPQVGNSIAGTTLTFRIWKDNEGVPGETLYQYSFQVRYTAGINNFYEVELPKPVSVKERFYAGWSQPGNLFVNIGFDRNERMPGRRFLFSSVSGWVEDELEGAVMLRPVMTGKALGLADEIAAKAFVLYPNPSKGTIVIESAYKSIRIYDATGREVHYQAAVPALQPISLQHLSNGVYTLRIETSKTILTKKLILTKP